MTLAECAARLREELKQSQFSAPPYGPSISAGVLHAIDAFEADPEFKLPERLDALVKEWEERQDASDSAPFVGSGPADPTTWPLMMAGDAARRLREVREGKP